MSEEIIGSKIEAGIAHLEAFIGGIRELPIKIATTRVKQITEGELMGIEQAIADIKAESRKMVLFDVPPENSVEPPTEDSMIEPPVEPPVDDAPPAEVEEPVSKRHTEAQKRKRSGK